MSTGLDEAGTILNANSRTLAPAAVGAQVGLMSAISVAAIIAFNILRPKNKIIYEPKVKYHVGNRPPPQISDSIFGWLPPLIHCKEPELVDKIGLDAVAFLRFCRLLRWLFTGVTLLTCGVLIPVNAVYNLKNVDSDSRDVLSMLTIRDVSGNILFVHVAVTYLITFLICFLVYTNWRKMVQLRKDWFRSPEYLQSFYARTLTIRHVPKKLQSDAGIKEIFQSVQVPYPTTSVHIGRKVGKLPDLIEFHNDTVRELEKHLVKYLKNGQVGKKRPIVRVGGKFGMGGVKKDAIEFYTAKLQRTEAAIEEYRRQINTRKAENYGFASMAAVPYAHIVARQLENKHPKGTDITLAPNPKDIIWKNMPLSSAEITTKKIHGFLWLAVVCFFNTVPLLIISVLANLSSLTAYVTFLEDWQTSSKGTFDIVSGVLPPVVSGIFGFFLPRIMRWLSKYMGALTHSRLDRAVVARYFSFLVISQLVVFTLIGVIFNSIKQIVAQVGKKSFKDIIDNLDTLPDTINSTYIDQSSYWLTFFPLRGFLVVFDLAQILNVIWIGIKTRLFGRTPRDIREWTQPPEFEFAIYYSNMLFMCAVGLVFAPLAPLVSLAACVVFWMGSFVYKYQLMFVFVSKVETGGRLWNVIINRLLFTVILMQALMILTIGLQYGFKSLYWLITVPPIIFMIIFKIYIHNAFGRVFQYYSPTPDELSEAKIHSERADAKGNRLEKRFGHPALNVELFTPMLHAKMMPLLSQVYNGKIGRQSAKLNEYGGQKMEAQVVEGGVTIAAIDQRDLEYDPALYQRDRGELDWDAKSMTSTTYLNDGSSIAQGNFASSTTLLAGYDRYLSNGPGQTEDYELKQLDNPHEPLLSPASQFYQNQSQSSLASLTPLQRQQTASTLNEAPLHRPQPTEMSGFSHYTGVPMERGTLPERSDSPFRMERIESPAGMRSNSPYGQQPRVQQQYSQDSRQSSQTWMGPPGLAPPQRQDSSGTSDQNMAGRGAFRYR